MNGFEKILYTEHRGKNNAITSKQIEKEFGYKGKDIRRIVNDKVFRYVVAVKVIFTLQALMTSMKHLLI